MGREFADDGSFRRQESAFRDWVCDDGSTEFPLEAGRYHLYVSRACPWAHRTIIGRRLMGLGDAIGISYVDPLRDERGWAFTGGEYFDPINGFEFVGEAYAATDPSYGARVTVPVLWDKQAGVIVNNESAEILRMLETVFAPLAGHPVDLYPEAVRDQIDALNDGIYENVNNTPSTRPGSPGGRRSTSGRWRGCSRRSTNSTAGSRSAGSCSAASRSRPTSGYSRPSFASTRSTRSTSSARCAS